MPTLVTPQRAGASQFVGREEFCDLLVSRRNIQRTYLEDDDVFVLHDVAASQQFLIHSRDLFSPLKQAAKARFA